MSNIQLTNVYILIQIIGVIILIFELIYVSLQKPSNLQKHFIIILLNFIISFVGYIIEMMPHLGLWGSFIGICLGYLSKPFAMIAFLLLILEYSNIKVRKSWIVCIVFYFLFLSVMMFTTPIHNMYYSYMEYHAENAGSPISIGHGLFWYVYMASTGVVFAAYSISVIYEYRQSKTKQAKQMAIILFFVAFFAFLGLILFITGISKTYDTTLLGMMLGSVLFLILLSKYRMFDALTTAQNKALNENGDGVLVLDARLALTYFNETAQKILPELRENMGRKNERLLVDELDKMDTEELIFAGDHVYKLMIEEDITPNTNILIGKTYMFKNITEHYHRGENLKKEINKATSRISAMQREALVAFANVVEARDGNTGEHVKSVSNAAYLIARELKNFAEYRNMDNKFIEIIRECAPLHDIGKIYVSDSVLLKPGKLTPEEFEIMKTHAAKGAEIIGIAMKQLEEPVYVKTSQEIARSHHERWDGTGYPDGLKGEKIPLSARILAVADVYDALRMKRSYKDAYSKEKSIEIIKEESGTHFDPQIVKAFLNIVKDLK